MRKTALYVLSAIVISTNAIAQEPNLDSLKKVLSETNVDTTRIRLLLDISREYELSEQGGLIPAQEAYRLSKTVDKQLLKARSEAALGYFYLEVGLDSGMLLINKARERYRALNRFDKLADIEWNLSLHYETSNDFDSAIYFLERSLELSEKAGYNVGIADANYALSFLQSNRGDNTEALRHALNALEYYKKAGTRQWLGDAFNQIGVIYDYMGLYPEALENYLMAKDIAVEMGDTKSQIFIANNLGILFDNMNNSEEALGYYNEVLEKAGIFDLNEDEATALNNISYIYLKNGDTLQAKNALKRSLKISKEAGMQCFDIYPLEGIGSLFNALGELDSADYYLHQTLEKALACEDLSILTSAHKSLGELYASQGKIAKATKALEKSLEVATDINSGVDIKASYLALFKFHKNFGSASKALFYLESYQLMSDSLSKASNAEKVSKLAAEYEFRKQVKVLETEQSEAQAAYDAEIMTQGIQNRYTTIALGLFILLGVTLLRSYYLIQKQNKKLKWLNEEKNTLMGVVAHDLRNPLNMIKGLMQLITGVTTTNEEEGSSEKYLHLIKMSTQKMSDMIEKVLDISAIESMKVNLDIKRVNLTELLEKSSENFDLLARKKNIEIENAFDPGLPHFANVDPSYFDQTVDNLISNAVKFSDSGEKISLDIKSEADAIVVSVKDEGPGISQEQQKNLFKKFKTLGAKPTSNEQSTGLGLSIVKKFITAMEGEIFCESELGQGATFYLKFKQA